MPTPKVDIVIIILDIKGLCHLIKIDKGKMGLINNRIDICIWNKVYDLIYSLVDEITCMETISKNT